ncbi:MAG: hypothetical protein WBK19_15920 [Azonexus sp.]
MIATHIDREKRLKIVFDSERSPATRYTIFFEGRDTVVVGQPFESAEAVWQRVLDTVAEMRAVIRRGAWRGREHYFAIIYADIEPTDEQRKEPMKDWITACLYQLADPARNKDGDSRVEALIALSELHDLSTHRFTQALNLCELAAAELVRRQ